MNEFGEEVETKIDCEQQRTGRPETLEGFFRDYLDLGLTSNGWNSFRTNPISSRSDGVDLETIFPFYDKEEIQTIMDSPLYSLMSPLMADGLWPISQNVNRVLPGIDEWPDFNSITPRRMEAVSAMGVYLSMRAHSLGFLRTYSQQPLSSPSDILRGTLQDILDPNYDGVISFSGLCQRILGSLDIFSNIDDDYFRFDIQRYREFLEKMIEYSTKSDVDLSHGVRNIYLGLGQNLGSELPEPIIQEIKQVGFVRKPISVPLGDIKFLQDGYLKFLFPQERTVSGLISQSYVSSLGNWLASRRSGNQKVIGLLNVVLDHVNANPRVLERLRYLHSLGLDEDRLSQEYVKAVAVCDPLTVMLKTFYEDIPEAGEVAAIENRCAFVKNLIGEMQRRNDKFTFVAPAIDVRPVISNEGISLKACPTLSAQIVRDIVIATKLLGGDTYKMLVERLEHILRFPKSESFSAVIKGIYVANYGPKYMNPDLEAYMEMLSCFVEFVHVS